MTPVRVHTWSPIWILAGLLLAASHFVRPRFVQQRHDPPSDSADPLASVLGQEMQHDTSRHSQPEAEAARDSTAVDKALLGIRVC